MEFSPTDLTGQLLVAMPGMGDPRFDQAVIFICAHSEEAAMGLIINKRAEDAKFSELAEQLDLDEPIRAEAPIHFGGPVEIGRGFVLHSPDFHSEGSTMEVADGFSMTATVDILEMIAVGRGPRRAMLAMGYSGWGPGQLEGEIARNGWLTTKATTDIVFGPDNRGKWSAALRALGVDPLTLSAEAGRA